MEVRVKNNSSPQKCLFQGYPSNMPVDKKKEDSNKQSEIEFVFDRNEAPEFWGSGF